MIRFLINYLQVGQELLLASLQHFIEQYVPIEDEDEVL